ncbi:acetyl-CoA carboxylase biotin carboxylase subunit [Firmicutes bacterium AM41-11]|nr:acetyl-CoA carboxylase biotin carboxylase subunit [Firmicutes bacterium AM41-11]CRH84481.1 acetyl-CoA carboxylase biotin carboxylase subunit [Chlamydia trachomatis]
MIQRVLIANRSEIAVRIIRACKEMGIETVAVYSQADKEALHVQMADQAVCIGASLASESYLNMNNLIQAACLTGCDAIHPGFGFLSENSRFARLVQECGLTWIGPRPEVIEQLGNKTEARKMMAAKGVPIIPGMSKALSSEQEGLSVADEIGYPIILKASNGGGGKGMRVVRSETEFQDAYYQTKSEAKQFFGDEDVYIEKFIENPKHIEVQLAGDRYGNCVHFYERDCSFQIDNQKMMEEAPCSCLSEAQRAALVESACKACKAAKYDSVGTVEFLFDGNQHYFMEMNTRIQVEHPITEMITGIDLIALQIRLAQGDPLPFTQAQIHKNGVAIECRINAEDVHHDFHGCAGKIRFYHCPGGNGIRVDSGIYSGYEVPPFYDSMLCKIIAYAPNRKACIQKMKGALEEIIVDGIETNEEFLYLALFQEDFLKGSYDTSMAAKFYQQCKKEELL